MAQDIHCHSKRKERGHSEEILDKTNNETHPVVPHLVSGTSAFKVLDGSTLPALHPTTHISFLGWFTFPVCSFHWQNSSGISNILGASLQHHIVSCQGPLLAMTSSVALWNQSGKIHDLPLCMPPKPHPVDDTATSEWTLGWTLVP